MNPDVFFKNFELLADSPNGVQKLRELILQLAVMGKLVPQDPNDEPVSMLVDKIKIEQKELGKEGKIKGSKSINGTNVDKIPYEIPSSWEWTTLSECGLINPRNDISDEKDVSFIPMMYISEKYGQNVEMEIRKWEEIKKGFTHFAENDVVLAKITPCFQNGKSAVMTGLKNGFGAGTTELHVFRPFKELVNPNYVLIYLKSPEFIYEGIPKMTGSAGQKRVPKGYFSENPFPLPPLAEQKRIVSKIDEMMALCDKLETRRQKKQDIQSKLNSAALDRMLSAENQEEFEQHWQRICENFDILYDNPENVGKLKQAILQLAVQGKLIPQNPEDEPASVLIEKIAAEKGRKQNRLNSSKVTDTLDLEFKLPKNWKLSRIEEFSLLVTDGEHKTPTRIDKPEVPLVTAKNVRDGYLDLGNTDFVSNDTAEKCWKRCNPSHNDVLMVCVGATTGRLCLIKNPLKFVLVRSVSLIRVDEKYIYPEYVALAMKSPFLQSQIWENVKQSAQPCLYLNKIHNLFVPLPPLAEQKRIVSKVEQFMGLCNELEAKLRKERENSEKLMEAVVKGLLEDTATEKPELDKPIPLQAAAIKLK